jgi:uncharacterized membrane protein YgaE (UPF0421/DUF939 family)
MDNTRHKAKRKETTTPEADATRRVYRALNSLAHAEAELHETGRVDSDLLDWTMQDIRNAMRRCQLYMREAKT